MSDLILSLPPLAVVRTHSPSNCGALIPETFLPPSAATTRRLLYLANPLAEKAPSATQATPSSERCAVKGCVFPASLNGHSK